MEQQQIDNIKLLLRTQGFVIAQGLAEKEIAAIQERYDFCFPDDLREMLLHFVPVGNGFYDWNNATVRPQAIRKALDAPVEGIVFDVKHNSFWMEEWGQRPTDIAAAVAVAFAALAKVPKLIPVYGHRYIPSVPLRAGNPVISVQQTDISITGPICTNISTLSSVRCGTSKSILTASQQTCRFGSTFSEHPHLCRNVFFSSLPGS